ncbi:hypothetical protein ACJJTC_010899 [Scirpophaga incertulas]
MDSDVLISLVFSKQPVWDKRDKRHCNRNVTDKWKEISEAMNKDENKVWKKWKYLRDQFAVEHGKNPVPRSGDGASTSYEPKWPYYKSLLFLKDIIKARKFSGNLTKSNRQLSVGSEPQTNDFNYVQGDSNLDQDNLNQDYSNPDQASTSNVSEWSASTKSSKESSVPRKKKTNIFNQNMLEIERQKLEYLKSKRIQNEESPTSYSPDSSRTTAVIS